MGKPHLVLWGGAWLPLETILTPETVNSHASVSFVFLAKALSHYFELTLIPEFEKIADLDFNKNIVGVLSTFQAGFTQLRDKKPEIYHEIAPSLKGKMLSIIDETTAKRTCEEKLFTVIPPDYALKNKIQNIINPSAAHHMGWCASPDYCYPEKKDDVFTIFVDHGHYAGPDYTDVVMSALTDLRKTHKLRVYIQMNEGVVEWDLDTPWVAENYDRSNKVPWIEMMAYYRQADLFCLTHKESAGLSSIEAAMCGAHLIVPQRGKDKFLHAGLLQDPVPFDLVGCDKESLIVNFKTHIENSVDKQAAHERLKNVSSWDQAAERIYKALI